MMGFFDKLSKSPAGSRLRGFCRSRLPGGIFFALIVNPDAGEALTFRPAVRYTGLQSGL